MDGVFGSCGDFFNFAPSSGSFEANPPFSLPLIEKMVDRMEALLARGAGPQEARGGGVGSPGCGSGEEGTATIERERGSAEGKGGALSFAVVMPAWTDSAAWARLQRCRFLQKPVLIIPRHERPEPTLTHTHTFASYVRPLAGS